MARVFITGSSAGLGLMAGQTLIAQGHEVVLHARNDERAAETEAAAPGVSAVLVADLSSRTATKALAEKVNALGRFDAVIHNAGVGYREARRAETSDRLPLVLAVNVLAPFILTALIERPARLIYLSSGMHQGIRPRLDDILWTKRSWNGSKAYAESKFYDTLLAFAIAQRWPDIRANAIEPGWVPTRMGGPDAPDDLAQGAITQAWLAVSNEPLAQSSGGYFYHQQLREPSPTTRDTGIQSMFMKECGRIAGVRLPA